MLVHPLSRCSLSLSNITFRRQAGHSMYLEPEPPTPRGLAAVADADADVACRRFLPPLRAVPSVLALAPPLPISSANASLLPPPLRFFLDELLIPSYESSRQDAAANSSWPGPTPASSTPRTKMRPAARARGGRRLRWHVVILTQQKPNPDGSEETKKIKAHAQELGHHN